MKPEQYCPNPKCGIPVNWAETVCHRCEQKLVVPNQRLVDCEPETQALEQKYLDAKEKAKQAGYLDCFEQVELQIKDDSHAVTNFDADTLKILLANRDGYITNYYMMVDSEIRPAADFDNGQVRGGVDSVLWADVGKYIKFAALSVNYYGLPSYGRCAVSYADISMENKATVLIENSYTFVERHQLKVRDCDVPKGYRAVWSKRYKVAMIKLVDEIVNLKAQFNTADSLLFSEGNRSTDQFIEVHIYGKLPVSSIETITLPKTPADEGEKYLFTKIRDLAGKAVQAPIKVREWS